MAMNAAAWMWMAWSAMAGFVGVYGWVWKKAGEKGRAWLEWGLAVLVAGVSLSSMLTHEPFTDELHAWLQARQMTVGELWQEMHCEGHFLPWHLLLLPFARWGAPVETVGWIAWGTNAAAVAWFVRKAPLEGWAKAAGMLSCVFLYVNPAIARCYVLVPPVLFGLAVLWGNRDERPVAFGALVALLANTHLCMEGTAAAVFAVYACENVLRRKDGKGWKSCRRQWAGLAVMVAGGAVALAQVLPSLWESGVKPGHSFGLLESTKMLLAACGSGTKILLAATGVAGLLAVAWKRERGVFWVLAGSLAYMWGFAVFVYPATVLNRAALWVPAILAGAWALAAHGGTARRWAGLAVAAVGLATMRPELTWMDWLAEYDPLRGACRWISETYGKDAEIWINGGDICVEGAVAYLDNVKDWRTGKRPEVNSYSIKRPGIAPVPFGICSDRIFRSRPGEESFLVLASMTYWNGLSQEDYAREGLTREWMREQVLDSQITAGEVILRVKRAKASDRGGFWMRVGLERYQAGDREGAVEAWKQAILEDGEAWEAMNNLAWVALEDGRVEEARGWIDRAMEHEAARESPGVRDTEEAVRKAEGNHRGEAGGEAGSGE